MSNETMQTAPLSPEEVRRLTADWVDPNYKPADKTDQSEPNYWYAEERAEIVQALKAAESRIFSMAVKGYSSQVIAGTFGVSRECIAKRLRGFYLLNPPSATGKPISTR